MDKIFLLFKKASPFFFLFFILAFMHFLKHEDTISAVEADYIEEYLIMHERHEQRIEEVKLLTGNVIDKRIEEKLINAAIRSRPLTIAIVGSEHVFGNSDDEDLIAWPQQLANKLNEVYGEGIVSVVLLDELQLSRTSDIVKGQRINEIKSIRPDILIVEPFLLNDNGIISVTDTLSNLENFLNQVGYIDVVFETELEAMEENFLNLLKSIDIEFFEWLKTMELETLLEIKNDDDKEINDLVEDISDVIRNQFNDLQDNEVKVLYEVDKRFFIKIKNMNPNLYVLLQAPNPIYLPRVYATQVSALQEFVNEKGMSFIDHWTVWPDTADQEILNYLDNERRTFANQAGHDLWFNYIKRYFINDLN